MINRRISRAPSGHRCGESHQHSKLTTDQVKEMRDLREYTGMGYAKLAAKFGCGESTVRDIVNYYTRISS